MVQQEDITSKNNSAHCGDTAIQELCIKQLLTAAGRHVGFADFQALERHWPNYTLFGLCAALAHALDEANPRSLATRAVEYEEVLDLYRTEKKLLAKLAATGPAFDNPLEAMAAKKLRDVVLSSIGLNPDGTLCHLGPATPAEAQQ